uniref:C2 domain-containing protein n=1 Tax=Macrostomum lignano TaxID=282301 RepID=A0A1I8JIY1_9PLAT
MGSNEKNLIGVYQCHPEDDIKNLKIRIKVWKITTDKNEEEVYDFKWQEKVFSVRELEKYKDVTDANATDHEKRCKKLLDQWKQMRHKMLKDHRLYSLIDDEIALESEEKDRVTDYEDEKLTATEVAFREAQRTQSDDAVGQQRNAATQSAASVLTSNLDREQFLRQFFTSPKSQRMRVMFDYRPVLRPEEPPAPAPAADGAEEDPTAEPQVDTTQKLLCTITYDPRDRLLSLQPDFTKQPLIVGNWRYTIEDVSTKMSEAERNRVLSQEKERIKLKSESKQVFRQIDFEMPTEPLRVLVRGEIMTAKHFEYDHLYVHFFLDLTPDWFVKTAAGLSGTTQICATKVEEVDDVAHFSYPFEFEIFFERLVPAGEDDYTFPRWPIMYFESARLAELRNAAAGVGPGGVMQSGAGAGKFSSDFGGAAGPSFLDLHRALNRFRTARTQLVMVQKAASPSLMMSLQQQQLISGGGSGGGGGGTDSPPRPAPRRRLSNGSTVAAAEDDDDQQRRGGAGDTLTAEYMRHIQSREE